MNEEELNLRSIRARKARLYHQLGRHFYRIALYLGVLFLAAASVSYAVNPVAPNRYIYIAGGVGLACIIAALWYRDDLAKLATDRRSRTLDSRLSVDVLSRLRRRKQLSPRSVWHVLTPLGQVVFYMNHLVLPGAQIEQQLSTRENDMPTVWAEASRLADATGSELVEAGHVAAALLSTSPEMKTLLTRLKMTIDDVEQLAAWEGRLLKVIRAPKPYFGGIGRDWANGYTPRLSQYGENVSLGIEHYGSQFSSLMASSGVQAVKNAFSQGASAVALIGEPGIGKTSHGYALAQLLLQESEDPNLMHRQLISLNPSIIIANSHAEGQLEYNVMMLLQEAIRAGNIILFLDDAQLFFANDVGSVDITRVLLPAIQNHAVQLVLAMTPNDYQHLKSDNAAFAALLTPITLQEPREAEVLDILEDTATGLESRHHVIVAYEAIRESYRLSGRYEQDMAYPGKAIRVLEQALTHAQQGIVTAASVQAAVEQSRGVKVGSARPAEAEQLLRLEDDIHKRMINQSRAVSAVANALRRARAGVANPNRPIGSFLFLGPTGVGKTELAKSIAATYFGSADNMIRLDMSEYQQPEDVARLLSNGESENASLIMAIRQQPFSVVLLDEIEKAHPNILNLLLQLLDEGKLTDSSGRPASFKDAVVIATSNAGAQTIRERVERGETLESFEHEFTDELISGGQFKPELLNRFDDIVLFRPLKPEELIQLVTLMMGEVNRTLATQNITVELTQAASEQIVRQGYDPRLGARPLRRALQRTVEDTIAARILSGVTQPGDHVILDEDDIAAKQPQAS